MSRRYGKRGGKRSGSRPLPKAQWSKLAAKIGPAKASALARSNPSKAKKMANGGRKSRR